MKSLQEFKQHFDFEIDDNLLVKPFYWVTFKELAYLEDHFLNDKISLDVDDGAPFYEFIEEITFSQAFELARQLSDNNLYSNMVLGNDQLDENEVGIAFMEFFKK